MKKKQKKQIKEVITYIIYWMVLTLALIGAIALLKPTILYPTMWDVETKVIYIFEKNPIPGQYV